MKYEGRSLALRQRAGSTLCVSDGSCSACGSLAADHSSAGERVQQGTVMDSPGLRGPK